MKKKHDPLEELPPPFCSDGFKEAWNLFEENRRNKRKPIGRVGRKLMYKRLAEMGEQRAIAALLWSAECEYQGIWEKPPERNGNGYQPSSKASRTQDAFARLRTAH